MSWGGSGRGLLDLNGEVDLADYRALFGIGGAHDPRSGRRLVGCLRPGLEIVISPHKSVAELGVIGRAEDMHEIVDAERDATLEYLDRLVANAVVGGGRAQTRVATGGLIWATSRHATTRAGDPQVHDHVLIANAVLMRDARGGWKGADTAFLRDHLHAATGGAWRQRPKRSSRMRDCRRSWSIRTTRRMGDNRDPAEVCELPNPMSGFSKTPAVPSFNLRSVPAQKRSAANREKSSSRPTLSSSETGSTSCTALFERARQLTSPRGSGFALRKN